MFSKKSKPPIYLLYAMYLLPGEVYRCATRLPTLQQLSYEEHLEVLSWPGFPKRKTRGVLIQMYRVITGR